MSSTTWQRSRSVAHRQLYQSALASPPQNTSLITHSLTHPVTAVELAVACAVRVFSHVEDHCTAKSCPSMTAGPYVKLSSPSYEDDGICPLWFTVFISYALANMSSYGLMSTGIRSPRELLQGFDTTSCNKLATSFNLH